MKPLVAALLFGIGAGAWAQDSAPTGHKERSHQQVSPEERAQRMTERMTTELQLDETQRPKVHTINQQLVREMEMLRAQRSDDKRDRVKEVGRQHEQSLQGVLTPAQFERFKQLKAERIEKQKAKKEQGARPATPGPEPQR